MGYNYFISVDLNIVDIFEIFDSFELKRLLVSFEILNFLYFNIGINRI